MYPAGGRFNYQDEQCIYLHPNGISGSGFTHELVHLIFMGNCIKSSYNDVSIWYRELLPIMSEVIFYGANIHWTLPNEKLFNWTFNDGGPSTRTQYNTYEKLAKFLVDKYGNAIFYDLMHETAKNIDKPALENILAKYGTTLSSMETEFADWCDNFGYPKDNETRIIIIENASLTGQVGIWLVENLPAGNASPVNTAIQSGMITDNKIVFSLVKPVDNTWNTGPAWIGSGDYYVFIVPIANSSYQWNNARVHTAGGNSPVKVTFNKAITRLQFSAFIMY
jgi:hypothetical protein